ncbi:MAG TPA: hypothetical protein PLA94_28645, partial [Myxococcota bacterium]|nr:hypothetical protein [Myxococcota bacterium]
MGTAQRELSIVVGVATIGGYHVDCSGKGRTMARIPYLVKQNEPTILVVERDNVKWEIILNMAIVGV